MSELERKRKGGETTKKIREKIIIRNPSKLKNELEHILRREEEEERREGERGERGREGPHTTEGRERTHEKTERERLLETKIKREKERKENGNSPGVVTFGDSSSM